MAKKPHKSIENCNTNKALGFYKNYLINPFFVFVFFIFVVVIQSAFQAELQIKHDSTVNDDENDNTNDANGNNKNNKYNHKNNQEDNCFAYLF